MFNLIYVYYGAFPKGMAFFLFAVKRPCLFTKSMAANKQGRLRSNKKGECGLMKSGYVVLTDYDCDPYLEFYEDYSEAKKNLIEEPGTKIKAALIYIFVKRLSLLQVKVISDALETL